MGDPHESFASLRDGCSLVIPAGVIPEELGDLTALITIDFSYIKLQGERIDGAGEYGVSRGLSDD